ncbi:hypothetical protein RHMOL_Rhmol06G0211000 [Rhododendron molle]|uniref:Uncharacterized protein n=1 Tax=Rhododendron molle TaxID=49168 RepID=A0ACC0NEJ0_RHOML|nr:hypothetical protein RHMOL_Rhmol06G0211000 [Rhododendron molle]
MVAAVCRVCLWWLDLRCNSLSKERERERERERDGWKRKRGEERKKPRCRAVFHEFIQGCDVWLGLLCGMPRGRADSGPLWVSFAGRGVTLSSSHPLRALFLGNSSYRYLIKL